MNETKILNNTETNISGITKREKMQAPKTGENLRKSGLDIIGDAPWGTHLCHFYRTKEDLLDILIPYFKAGLENNEFCMWVTSEPITEEEAKEAIRKAIPHFDQYLMKGQIEIVPHTQWYLKDGVFNLQRVLDAWIGKLDQALAKGYDGMRVTGNTAWLEKRDWKNFTHYEESVNSVIGKYKMTAICTYHLDKCGSFEVIDVVRNHQFALIKREGIWELIESTERKKVEEMFHLYGKIMTNMSEGVYAIRASDRIIIYTNPKFEEIFGYAPGELIGKHVSIVNAPTNKSPEETAKEIIKVLNKEGLWRGEICNIKKDGTSFWCYASVSVIEYAKYGEVWVSMHTDITERKKAEEKLKEYTLQLGRQKSELEKKNIAFREVIREIEIEKNETKSNISNNINEFVIPTLKKLRLKGASRKYVKLLEDNLAKITSSFGSRVTERTLKLTPREIEICNMIKGNLASKEIANLLNISFQTVDKHRKDIRKKIGISAKKLNLTSFLQSL